MAWWQWPFFCLGIAAAFSLAVVLAAMTVRWMGLVFTTTTLGRSSTALKQPEPRDTDTATSTEAPVRSVISTQARVG
jgi:hypothetical protein